MDSLTTITFDTVGIRGQTKCPWKDLDNLSNDTLFTIKKQILQTLISFNLVGINTFSAL